MQSSMREQPLTPIIIPRILSKSGYDEFLNETRKLVPLQQMHFEKHILNVSGRNDPITDT